MPKVSFKNIIRLLAIVLVMTLILRKCSFSTLPDKIPSNVKIEVDHSYVDSVYTLKITNTLGCPMRFFLSSDDKKINTYLKENSPYILGGLKDTIITIGNMGDLTDRIKFNIKYGDPNISITTKAISSLPFPKGKKYKLLQGNNSNPTHNHSGSRYAFDFTLKIGDTITSVQNGYVVAVVDGYSGWGRGDKWKAYANQVMVYDTSSHLFTMYGHLVKDGALIEVGDFVNVGEPIALSGKTGQSPEEHLHFNVLIPDNTKKGTVSYALDSIGKYKVAELKRHQWMEH